MNLSPCNQEGTERRRAETPTLFVEDRFVDAPAIFVPMVKSAYRISAGIVANNKLIPHGDLYLFGVLTSSVHMAWVKTVAGRLKSDFSYGVQTVYDTFPFCQPTGKQKRAIEKTAQKILEIRNTLSDASESPTTRSDLYGSLTTPKALKTAHRGK